MLPSVGSNTSRLNSRQQARFEKLQCRQQFADVTEDVALASSSRINLHCRVVGHEFHNGWLSGALAGKSLFKGLEGHFGNAG